jgi:hypothetical protein
MKDHIVNAQLVRWGGVEDVQIGLEWRSRIVMGIGKLVSVTSDQIMTGYGLEYRHTRSQIQNGNGGDSGTETEAIR